MKRNLAMALAALALCSSGCATNSPVPTATATTAGADETLVPAQRSVPPVKGDVTGVVPDGELIGVGVIERRAAGFVTPVGVSGVPRADGSDVAGVVPSVTYYVSDAEVVSVGVSGVPARAFPGEIAAWDFGDFRCSLVDGAAVCQVNLGDGSVSAQFNGDGEPEWVVGRASAFMEELLANQ